MRNAQVLSHEVCFFTKTAPELFSVFVQPTCIRKRRKSISYIPRSHIRGQAYMLDCKWHWIGLPPSFILSYGLPAESKMIINALRKFAKGPA